MQVVLIMFRPNGERRSFSLPRNVTVIGRREDCDLRIPLGEVSRKHCRLLIEDDTVKVEDLGSSNGTYHNGQRVQEAVLSPGDTIQVGPVVFTVQLDGVPADEEIQPPAPRVVDSAGDTNVAAAPLEMEGDDSAAGDAMPLAEDEAAMAVDSGDSGSPVDMDIDLSELAAEESSDLDSELDIEQTEEEEKSA